MGRKIFNLKHVKIAGARETCMYCLLEYQGIPETYGYDRD
jgi:hypothetical protein